MIGVSEATLYRWLAGSFEPDLVKLARVAAVTKVRLAWLVTGEGARRCRTQSAREASK